MLKEIRTKRNKNVIINTIYKILWYKLYVIYKKKKVAIALTVIIIQLFSFNVPQHPKNDTVRTVIPTIINKDGTVK
jgi:hypothetical protein